MRGANVANMDLLSPCLTPCRVPVLVPGIEQRSRVFDPGRIAVHEIMAFTLDTLKAWSAESASPNVTRALSELLHWLLHNEPCPLGTVATVWIDRPLVFVDLADRSTAIPNLGLDPSPTDQVLRQSLAKCTEDWGAELTTQGRCLWASFHAGENPRLAERARQGA